MDCSQEEHGPEVSAAPKDSDSEDEDAAGADTQVVIYRALSFRITTTPFLVGSQVVIYRALSVRYTTKPFLVGIMFGPRISNPGLADLH